MSTSLDFGSVASWYKGLATGFASSTDNVTDLKKKKKKINIPSPSPKKKSSTGFGFHLR